MENWYVLIGRDYGRVMLLLASVQYVVTTVSLMLGKTSLNSSVMELNLLHNCSWTSKQ